jgi:hypothetical protein
MTGDSQSAGRFPIAAVLMRKCYTEITTLCYVLTGFDVVSDGCKWACGFAGKDEVSKYMTKGEVNRRCV